MCACYNINKILNKFRRNISFMVFRERKEVIFVVIICVEGECEKDKTICCLECDEKGFEETACEFRCVMDDCEHYKG